MDEKYFWPLVGVTLGWLLTLVATSLKDRAEDRRKIGVLVAKLLVVYEQVKVLIVATELIKVHIDSWENYERMRMRISEKHFLEPASHVESLRGAIDEVSGQFPLQAIELHGLLDMLLKNKQASLIAMSHSKDLYVRSISMYEVGLDIALKRLRTHIRVLSFHHGLATLLRVMYREKRREENKKVANDFVGQFAKESFEEIQRISADSGVPPRSPSSPN